MNKKSKNIIISNLDWSAPIELQTEAILYLSKASEEELFQAYEIIKVDKSKWENFVTVIDTIDYPQNKPLLHFLFELLKDLNWPGAQKGVQILQKINRADVLKLLEHYIPIAYIESDEMWMDGLKYLINQLGINKESFSDNRFFEMLKISDWQ